MVQSHLKAPKEVGQFNPTLQSLSTLNFVKSHLISTSFSIDYILIGVDLTNSDVSSTIRLTVVVPYRLGETNPIEATLNRLKSDLAVTKLYYIWFNNADGAIVQTVPLLGVRYSHYEYSLDVNSPDVLHLKISLTADPIKG